MRSQPLNGESSLSLAPKNGKALILSVDDEPGILFTRQVLLESAGYQVLSAADGEQALHFFLNSAVDLVLLDYIMRGMNGEAVAREIKKRKPLVPVVMVSATSVAEKTLPFVDCLITKGEDPGLLLEKIRQLLPSSPTAHLQTQEKSTGDGHPPSGKRGGRSNSRATGQ